MSEALRKKGEAIAQKAFLDETLAKAALIVIHRVARANRAGSPEQQQAAMDHLTIFAMAHPLPPDVEKLL